MSEVTTQEDVLKGAGWKRPTETQTFKEKMDDQDPEKGMRMRSELECGERTWHDAAKSQENSF